MNLDDEDYERLEELRNLPLKTVVEALRWWNEEADESLKRFVAVSAYYEVQLHSANLIDEVSETWENEE